MSFLCGFLCSGTDFRKARYDKTGSFFFGRFVHLFVSLSVNELAEKNGITETLKTKNQMLLVQQMNAVREIATEFVQVDIIFYCILYSPRISCFLISRTAASKTRTALFPFSTNTSNSDATASGFLLKRECVN